MASWSSQEEPLDLATLRWVSADAGAEAFGILSNPHLSTTARTIQFQMTVDLSIADEVSYDQQTFMHQPRSEDLYCHRDCNTLARIRE